MLQPDASLLDVSRVPAPWALDGHAWIVLLRLPRQAAARRAFVPEKLQHSVRTPVSALMAVEYTSAPCGAYRELLFIPGTMRFDDGRRYASISRILVSTWASVVNGRANWGIPKDLAAFSIERGADRDVVAVGDGHRQCCRLEFEPPRGPRLPLSTRWLPPSWRTLAQVRDGRTYYYELRAQGSLRPARLVHWWFDPQHVPDLTSATVLATVRVEAFRMEFPVARVDDALRPARTDAPAGPRP